MSPFLLWQNLVFAVPLGLAALLVASATLGAADLDLDVDGEVDVDVDAGFASGWGLLALLGFGRAPFIVVLISLFSIFGGAGVISRQVTDLFVESLTLSTFIAAFFAATAAFFGTGAIARLVAKHLPAIETYAGDEGDLVGTMGTVDTPVTGAFGLVRVTDASGTFHQIRCRSEGAVVTRGTHVVVTDFDADAHVYIVTPTDF